MSAATVAAVAFLSAVVGGATALTLAEVLNVATRRGAYRPTLTDPTPRRRRPAAPLEIVR